LGCRSGGPSHFGGWKQPLGIFIQQLFIDKRSPIAIFSSWVENSYHESASPAEVAKRISGAADTKFTFECSSAAKNFLLKEGIDYRYGARHLKRAIERLIVHSLANLVTTEQVSTNDSVYIDFDNSVKTLSFSKKSSAANTRVEQWEEQHSPIGVGAAVSVSTSLAVN
jgi:hypothetical protein